MPTQNTVSTLEVSDETLVVQIYQTLDEALAETSDLDLLKSSVELIGEAYQKALALLAQAEVKAKPPGGHG